MNKKTKGAIAAGAAAALLAGGAGTFATWTDSTSVSGGTITAGELKLVAAGTNGVKWHKATVDGGGAVALGAEIPNIANYRIVPGETLAYVATQDFVAYGDNLNATITVTPGTGGTNTFGTGNLTWGATTLTGTGITGSTISSSADQRTATITKTVKFSDVGDQVDQGATAALANMTLTLQQG
ncbi:hypothetical protein RE943_10010 [Prescottella equi]|uniref:alternate-type signal peptide domain-containing protein n=1 Tax=Rhodococcus hoagii TaxID=43767 RepID=UPI001C759CBC|nr:alternate-type signal peptide domain-containing protein [Prescottella equi]BCN67528.1 hypothetical protein RE943_10010 [Prescottella equi]